MIKHQPEHISSHNNSWYFYLNTPDEWCDYNSKYKTSELSKIEVWLHAEIVEIAKRLHLYQDSSSTTRVLSNTCTLLLESTYFPT